MSQSRPQSPFLVEIEDAVESRLPSQQPRRRLEPRRRFHGELSKGKGGEFWKNVTIKIHTLP